MKTAKWTHLLGCGAFPFVENGKERYCTVYQIWQQAVFSQYGRSLLCVSIWERPTHLLQLFSRWMMITEFKNGLSFLSVNISSYVGESSSSNYLNVTWNCSIMQWALKKNWGKWFGMQIVDNVLTTFNYFFQAIFPAASIHYCKLSSTGL